MRAAPLKPNCLVCRAPTPTLIAINDAIWTEDGARYTLARSKATKVAHDSGVPSLEKMDPKTIDRHIAHVEETWREIPSIADLRDREAVMTHGYGDVMDQGSRLAVKAMSRLENLLDQSGDILAILKTKEVIDIAALGVRATESREKTRLARNQQAIDVAALFGASAGFFEPETVDEEAGEILDVQVMKSELAEERRLLTAGRDG